jgi:imidazolonepropionase-like amidohydrolase
MEMATAAMYTTVERAYRRGVPIAAGSDAAMPYVRHGEISFEMVHLAHAGLSSMDTIAAATRVAADALGLGDRIGQVRPGYEADLIVVDGDPTLDVGLLQTKERILVVMQRGKITVDRR